jgi:ankyrin repeat protein
MIDSIYKAIKVGSIEDLNKLLAQDIDDVLDGGWNPLHAASKVGNLRAVELILSYIQKSGNVSFDVNSEFESIDSDSDNRGTALTEAMLNGHKDIAKLLIVNGANVNATYYSQDTDCPEWFLGEYDLAINSGVAWWLSEEELFNLCLANGLEIDAEDNNDNTALVYAVKSSNLKKVIQLLENGANVNLYYQHEYMGKIPLLVYAVTIHGEQKTQRSFDVVKSLLKHGAPLSAKCLDCENETVIEIVLNKGNEKLIDLFGLAKLAEKANPPSN